MLIKLTFQWSSTIRFLQKMADNESQAAGDSTAPAAPPAVLESLKLKVVGQVSALERSAILPRLSLLCTCSRNRLSLYRQLGWDSICTFVWMGVIAYLRRILQKFSWNSNGKLVLTLGGEDTWVYLIFLYSSAFMFLSEDADVKVEKYAPSRALSSTLDLPSKSKTLLV